MLVENKKGQAGRQAGRQTAHRVFPPEIIYLAHLYLNLLHKIKISSSITVYVNMW
jgi:hypothetical protein